MLSRTYETGGCDARYNLSLVGEYAFFSTWTPQKEALLRDSSGRDGKIIFKHFWACRKWFYDSRNEADN